MSERKHRPPMVEPDAASRGAYGHRRRDPTSTLGCSEGTFACGPQHGSEILLVFRHSVTTRACSLADGEMVIVGRESPSDVCLTERSLSREHASFRRDGDRVEVRDLQSKNGTFVRGERIQAASLAPGDALFLGRVVVMVYGAGRSSSDVPLFEAALHGFDRTNISVALLDAHGDCAWINARFGGLLKGENGISLTNGRLAFSDRKASRWLQALLRDFAATDPQEFDAVSRAVLVERPSGARSLLVRALPTQPQFGAATGSRFLCLTVVDPDWPPRLDAGLLRAVYGITDVEAEVANALMCGLSPGEIADRRDVGVPTIRTHLKNLFAKTDTRRQSDLVRVLLHGAAAIGE